MGAISAIDIALWDIAGKYFGCPVYQLLGGKVRNKARVYYHVGGGEIDTMVKNLKEAKAKGFTAVGHLSPFLDEPRTEPFRDMIFAKKINEAVERVAAYREAVGNDVDLCIEIHRRLNIPEAIAFARGIEEYTPYFLEDPTKPDNFDNMEYIAHKVNIPIATGERYHTPEEFAMLIKHDGAQYVRTDICLCGGITGGKKIASMAEANGVMVVPHNPLSPVSTAACIQIAACSPNFALQEYLPEQIAGTKFYDPGPNDREEALRNPDAVRPWQHVLEPLSGYLQLAGKLYEGKTEFADAWNFGPAPTAAVTVKEAAAALQRSWPEVRFRAAGDPDAPHEARLLRLDCSKAQSLLHWHGVWEPETAFRRTAEWYRDFYLEQKINTDADFDAYFDSAAAAHMEWMN